MLSRNLRDRPLWRAGALQRSCWLAIKGLFLGSLLIPVSGVNAAPARIGLLAEPALAMVTHATCTVVPVHKSGKSRYVLIEGPSCPVGGGSCDHVALMRIDGKTRTLTRKGDPAMMSSGAFSAEFGQGDFHVRVEYGAPPAKARDKRTAKIALQSGAGQEIMSGVAQCGGE